MPGLGPHVTTRLGVTIPGIRGSDVATQERRVNRSGDGVPLLLTVEETAWLLRTTPRAIYVMAGRHRLPGVVRLGRRLLISRADLVDWLARKRVPLAEE